MPTAKPLSVAAPQTRQTRQRDALRHIVAEAPGPLSVAELLSAAQQRLESIGIATVYRTVRMMEEAGEIRPVVLPGGETRWESSDRGHHHHFQCRVCSKVTDFHGCPLHVHTDSLPPGYLVETHEITLLGICPACSPQGKTARKAPPKAPAKARSKPSAIAASTKAPLKKR
jgi:Fur family ferric uptake transcriptional regulator